MFKDKKTQADGNICLTAEKNNTEMILRAIEAMRTRVKTEAAADPLYYKSHLYS